ncbi:hypothetical protein HKCCE3408_14765 [Rhodobacterales bacterium HKCCE3408]|nr:hypothetical protein [Rhodobacterales bacterium HKCCE3408]
MTVVVSQSMYFPWVGLLEQIRLADIFVHYDDVQFARGFYNRVQIKTAQGTPWMTVPTRDRHRGQRIDEVRLDDRVDWRSDHRRMLETAYQGAPHLQDALKLADDVFTAPVETLADVGRLSILGLARYFGLETGTRFENSSDLGVAGSSSQRLHDITRSLGGNVYVTGHGAKNYLDHHLFERSGIEVRYMNYESVPYPQLHGSFTPYVTGLDLVANCGQEGADFIRSDSVNWRSFVDGSD